MNGRIKYGIATLAEVALAASLLLPVTASAQTVPACTVRVLESARLNNGSTSAASLIATDGDGRVRLGRKVFFADGTSVSGVFVALGNGASVFNLNSGEVVKGRGVEPPRGTETSGFTGAPFDCVVSPVVCGGANVTVAKNTPHSITPGTYASIELGNGARLTMAPGVYTVCEFRTGKNARVQIEGPGQTTINVAGNLRIYDGSVLEAGFGVPPPVINVSGAQVRLGSNSDVQAFLQAPEARLGIGRSARFAGAACARSLVGARNVELECADVGPTTTTTTMTTTTTTTSTSSTSSTSSTTTTTTTTTAPPIQCCIPGSPMGAFACMVLSATECSASGGTDLGPGTCVPDPCGSSTTTTQTPTTTVTSTTATTTTSTTTTTTTEPPIQCCIPGSPMGAFACMVLSATECSTAGGTDLGPGTCVPDPCGSSTTTTETPTTTVTSTTATTTTSTTTTTTTEPPIQCCVPGSPMGAFACTVLSATECSTAGGTDLGPGTCVPDPCGSSTTTTETPTTTVTSTTATTTTSTTTTTEPPIQCCIPGSPMGAFTCSVVTALECVAVEGSNQGPGTCAPDPCGTTSTTTTEPPSTTVTTTTVTTTTSTTSTTTSTTVTTTTVTTTTSTSTTSTTLLPTVLDFATGTPGGTCGETRDASNVLIKNLTCGGLNIGGGQSIVAEGPTPDGSISRFSLSCAGSTCTIGPTNVMPAVNTAGPDCTDVGCNFGTPLPIPNPALPSLTTCVLNTWASPASGSLNLGTGASTTNVNLTSDVYLTGNLTQPCPKCSATGTPSSPGTGTCDRGPRATLVCTTTSSTGITRDCPTGGVGSAGTPCPGGPGGGTCPANNCPCGVGGGNCCDGSHVGPINVNLTPLTTGTASVTNATGIFCPGQTTAGCFGSTACRTIIENGNPAGPITPGTAASATQASVFCIAATGNGLVDASANLPGPGAVSLPGTFTVN